MLARIVRLADCGIRILPMRGLALAFMWFMVGQVAVIRMPRFAVQHVARGAHAGVGDCGSSSWTLPAEAEDAPAT